jgi:hypothetical protein
MTTAWMTPCDDTFGDDHSVDDRAAKRLHAVSSGTVITRSVSSQLVVSSFEEGHHEVLCHHEVFFNYIRKSKTYSLLK